MLLPDAVLVHCAQLPALNPLSLVVMSLVVKILQNLVILLVELVSRQDGNQLLEVVCVSRDEGTSKQHRFVSDEVLVVRINLRQDRLQAGHFFPLDQVLDDADLVVRFKLTQKSVRGSAAGVILVVCMLLFQRQVSGWVEDGLTAMKRLWEMVMIEGEGVLVRSVLGELLSAGVDGPT